MPRATSPRSSASTQRVRGSRTGRPVMALLDLLGRRWTMRVLWELRAERQTFRALQDACDGVSPAVLNDRLRELRDARLVDLGEVGGYGLTSLGRELLERFTPIVGWAEKWARATQR
jgi:DNA-binding HxlR family transcriptional regulator